LGPFNVTNNIVKAYALWAGLKLAKDMKILDLTILGDSMLVARAMIERHIIGTITLLVS